MPTVLELRKKAAELAIPNRSKMKKHELESAIANAQKNPAGKIQPGKLTKPSATKRMRGLESVITTTAKEIAPDVTISPTTIIHISSILNAFIKVVSKDPTISGIKTLLTKPNGEPNFFAEGMIQFIKSHPEKGVTENAALYVIREIVDLAIGATRHYHGKKTLPSHLIRVINDDEDLRFLICSIKPIKGIKC